MNKRQRKKCIKKYRWPTQLFHYNKKFRGFLRFPRRIAKGAFLWPPKFEIVSRRIMKIDIGLKEITLSPPEYIPE